MKISRRPRVRLILMCMSLLIGVAFTVLLATTPVQAADTSMCPMTPTLPALRACVEHAEEIGGITSARVTHRLINRVRIAQDAVEDHHPAAAVAALDQFIRDVRLYTGTAIQSDHADHLIMHAQMVIQALKRG